MWGTLFTAFSGTAFSDTGLLEFVSLMGVVGIFARTCWCRFFMRIFWCGFLCADFWVRNFLRGFWRADFFRGFCDGLRGFWHADFFCGFFWAVFPQKKPLKNPIKKSTENPHQRSSPRSVSSQYATTLLLAKHCRSPQGVWVQMHLVENPYSLRRWLLSGRMNV